MYKKHNLVLLPTDKISPIFLKDNNQLEYNDKPPLTGIKFMGWKYQNLYVLSDEPIKEGDWVLDTIQSNLPNSILQCNEEFIDLFKESNGQYQGWKKVIATTDKNLTTNISRPLGVTRELPQLPTSFIEYYIEQYNIGNKIEKIMVEYEEMYEYPNGNISKIARLGARCKPIEQLKLNSNNEISIKSIKTRWSREEVIAYGKLTFEVGRNFQLTGENNIKEIETNL